MPLTILLALALVLSAPEAPFARAVPATVTLALVFGYTLLAACASYFGFRWAVNALGDAKQAVQKSMERMNLCQWALRIYMMAAFGSMLGFSGYVNLVRTKWNLGPWVLVDEWLLFLPFMTMQLLHWWFSYPADRAVRERMWQQQLEVGLPIRPIWKRHEYMTFQIRQQLLLFLVPISLLVIVVDGYDAMGRPLEQLPYGHWWQGIGGAVLLVIVLLAAPLLIRLIWGAVPLADGPLRRRLTKFCNQIPLGYRDILVWRTHGMISNAAVMGFVSPLRYVLLTDALIESMPDEQIEAIFGHEAGHVAHHHMGYYLVFAFCAMLWSFLVVSAVDNAFGPPIWVSEVGSAVFVLLLWGIGFGWISRRFEWQADLYGARCVDDRPDQGGVGGAGANLFASALTRVAMLNGIPPLRRSWRHGSIAYRIEHLMALSLESGRAASFQGTCRRIRGALLLSLAVGIVLLWANLHFQ